jgi:hypothetical protein
MTHGRHIKVLGRGFPSQLGDVNAVRTMLVDLIDVLGMRMLDKAHMYEVETEISKLGAPGSASCRRRTARSTRGHSARSS